MNIDSFLKKEGIENIQKINSKEVNIIAKDIAIKLCLAFPENKFSRKSLAESISSLNMYSADLKADTSKAKYYYKNNSIYFSNDLEFDKYPEVAMHECIHFFQSINGKNRLGLCDSAISTAINEAAVQLMASEANMQNIVSEKYFDISLDTNTPDYYPLECALLRQMSYFTGTTPLYVSTFYSNDTFKNDFSSRYGKKTYNTIVKNLNKLLLLENELAAYSTELAHSTKENAIKQLNYIIDFQKNAITTLFFNTQNYIIKQCFGKEFCNISSSPDLHTYKNLLYNYKSLIGYTKNYTFYNDFYRDMMKALEIKKEKIYSQANTSTALTIVDKNSLSFVKTLFSKVKKLFGIKSTVEDYNL